MKLYYRKGENATAAVREFRWLKQKRRRTMSERALRDMIVKFKRTRQLDLLPGRGRKKNCRHRDNCYSGGHGSKH